MNAFKQQILGHKISKIIYSEVNDHEGTFYFDGFDTFDHAINIQMENGFCWNVGWKNQEYFELGEGLFTSNDYINKEHIQSWDATNRWKKVLNSKVSNLNFIYIDEACLIISRIEISFENNEVVTILIAESIDKNQGINSRLEYDFGGVIYIFHNRNLLTKKHE